MNNEKRCWMCRRTQKEIINDLHNYIYDSGMPDDHVLFDVDIGGQKLQICQGCNAIIYDLTRHDEKVDEYDLVLFDDLWKFQEKLKTAFEDE